MNSSSAEVGPGIDPTLLDDALSRARAFGAMYPLGALTVVTRKTGHPAVPAAVLADVHASVSGRHVAHTAV
ncbi:hypothetical protein AB0J40_09230 [Amycolatopsis sp. NPDC049691]|uniref:hypothetical protein n=1 Tax=Amycolatopsis sp. NPDC049691 TaxID=3155155 RepID=UPI003413247F